MINAEQLNAIKERAAKATPGPWRSAGLYGVRTQNAEALSIPLRPEDATFIAHAREDVPALVAEVERLTTVKHRLNSEIEIYRKQYEGAQIQLNESEVDNERLRKALEFYAEDNLYVTQYDSDFNGRTNAHTQIKKDNGNIAKEALGIGEESNAL